MNEVLGKLKNSFVTQLTDLIDGSEEIHGDQVLYALFVLCRACKQSGVKTTDLFNSEGELHKTEKQIIDALPLLEENLRTRVNTLGMESAQRHRIFRSGLEYIKEDFAHPSDSDWLACELQELMTGRQVYILNRKLEAWQDQREENDSGEDPVDLRRVPKSHRWWSQLERMDSFRVFGSKKKRNVCTDQVVILNKMQRDLRRAAKRIQKKIANEKGTKEKKLEPRLQEQKLLTLQNALLDRKAKLIEEDKEARREYDNFKNNALKDPNQLGANSEIDQNNRIIKAVTYMDAEMVFKTVAATGSTIRFANGETLDLLINSQLEVHPRAINQMSKIAKTTNRHRLVGTRYNDLEPVMVLTQQYDKRGIDVKDYLRDIRCLLRDYQMITRAEIDQVTQQMKKMTQDAALREHIGRMTPGEAYRMRTVLMDADERCLDFAYGAAKEYGERCLDLAYGAAKEYGDTSIESLAAWIEIVKLETHDAMEETWKKPAMYTAGNIYRNSEIAGLQRERKTEDRAKIILEIAKLETREFKQREDLKAARQDLQYRQDAFKKSTFTSEKNLDYQSFYQSIARRNAIIESNVAVSLNRICETIKKEEQPGIANPVVAYYLDRKHKKRLQRYYDEQGWEILADRSHFSGEKIGSFLRSLVGPIGALHPYDKIISQDGKYTITMYKTTAAVTKCKYDGDHEREAREPAIRSHYATPKRSPCTNRQARESQNQGIQPTPVTSIPSYQTVQYNEEWIACVKRDYDPDLGREFQKSMGIIHFIKAVEAA